MRRPPSLDLRLADTGGSSAASAERGRAMLEMLHGALPVDGAWLALADPFSAAYHSLASVHVDEPVVRFLAGPVMARDIEVTGVDRPRPPLSPSDLPYPATELPTWADCLLPAGIHEALAVALFTPEGRHVGFLALLLGDRRPPAPAVRRQLARVAPIIARSIDPMRSLQTAARLVHRARAGVVLGADDRCHDLPGLPGHDLLVPGSPLLAAAAEAMSDGDVCTSFLWPVGGRHAPDGHVRATVLTAPDDVCSDVLGLVILSPAGQLRGLTPRELEVLGLVVEGLSNAEIAAALVVAPRTAAAHLEHILHKMDAVTRTSAAVRAQREGLYVPAHRAARAPVPHPWRPT